MEIYFHINNFFILPGFTTDPYDPNEKDLSKCNAIESSLWELKVSIFLNLN